MREQVYACPVCSDEALGQAAIRLNEFLRMVGSAKAKVRRREAVDELKHAETHLAGYGIRELTGVVRSIRKDLQKGRVSERETIKRIKALRDRLDVQEDDFFEDPGGDMLSCVQEESKKLPRWCTPDLVGVKRGGRFCYDPFAACSS